MLSAFLIRDDLRADCTRGVLYAEGEIFHILERPWLDNKPDISCICSGCYTVQFLPRSSSGLYRNVYWVREVQQRGGILIHSGNTVSHTKGCLIIGKRRGLLAGKPAVLNSKTALFEFSDLMGQEEFQLTIFGDQSC